MDRVEIDIVTASAYRATEIVADLRNAAEVLYHPMKSVGYWDVRSSDHRCPQAALGSQCPHVLPRDNPKFIAYEQTISDLEGFLDIYFPHGQVHIYIG